MSNEPALIVRHQRFTLVIGVLLAGLLAIGAIGVSVELHRAHAAIALVLFPQVFVVFAAYMMKVAHDRWATSMVCLVISAEGLSLPGMVTRTIPWTAVRGVRDMRCCPVPGLAAMPRHYVLFDVVAPDSFGVHTRGLVRRHMAPLPRDVPLLSVDVSEFDAGPDAILAAVRRFHPAAVAEQAEQRSLPPAAIGNDASIGFPTAEQIRRAVRSLPAQTDSLLARRGEIWPAAVAQRQRLVTLMRRQAEALIAAVVAVQRTTTAQLRAGLLSRREAASALLARRREVVRSATLALRHRLDRSF